MIFRDICVRCLSVSPMWNLSVMLIRDVTTTTTTLLLLWVNPREKLINILHYRDMQLMSVTEAMSRRTSRANRDGECRQFVVHFCVHSFVYAAGKLWTTTARTHREKDTRAIHCPGRAKNYNHVKMTRKQLESSLLRYDSIIFSLFPYHVDVTVIFRSI